MLLQQDGEREREFVATLESETSLEASTIYQPNKIKIINNKNSITQQDGEREREFVAEARERVVTGSKPDIP